MVVLTEDQAISSPQSAGQSPTHPKTASKVKNPRKEGVHTETSWDAPNPSNKPRRRNRKKKQPKTEQSQGEGLTPYQGPFRAFGIFYCGPCKKEWFSANSWADKYQKCNECNARVYPHRQFPLERNGPKQGVPQHPQNQCQKCMELGYACVGLYVDSARRRKGKGNESFAREE